MPFLLFLPDISLSKELKLPTKSLKAKVPPLLVNYLY
jgi:hypothetical protein